MHFVLLLSMWGLSQVEEMLSLEGTSNHVHLPPSQVPRGQYGYSGHVLNLPMDVTSFVNELPRCSATLDAVIV